MNDEQKAKSLWYNWCPATTCQGFISCVDCPHAHAHSQLLEMAAWKEQQMIEKAVEWLKNNIDFHDNSGGYERERKLQDFKKAMEAD